MEDGIRERFGIQLGDEIRFDVMGRVIAAQVTSVRRVDWDRARSGGFMFVFNPAHVRAGAACLHRLRQGTVRGGGSRAAAARSVAAYPNVSVIDIREILDRARTIIDNISLAISIVGLVALAGGALILAGAVAMTRFQRVYEAAILRTLGATSRRLAAMLAFEYRPARSARRDDRLCRRVPRSAGRPRGISSTWTGHRRRGSTFWAY